MLKKLLEQLHGRSDCQDDDRRKHLRLVYPPGQRAVLRIGDHRLEVLNISESGVKFLNHLGRDFRPRVYGTIDLVCGKSVQTSGQIAWRTDNEIGLFVTGLSPFLILDEVQFLLKQKAAAGK